jgi:pimeloyl-ACP methyl ester carboxylesterase
MAENTKHLMDTLSIDTAIVVGFAMGSAIAQQLARRYPESVSHLVLLSAVLKWDNAAKAHMDTLIQMREHGNELLVEEIYNLCFGNTFKANTSLESFKQNMASVAESQSLEDQKRQLAALKAFDSSNWASSIGVPVKVIAPTEDLFSYPENGQAVAEATGGDLINIECGHSVLNEKPEELLLICQEIIRNICQSSDSRELKFTCMSVITL